MTRLVSGKVLKTDSANVSADRYQFIEISEAEPDLGLPSSVGQVFTSDLNGNRYWINLDTANINESSNLYYTNSRVLAHLAESNVTVQELTVVGNIISGLGTGGSITGANLIVANVIVALDRIEGAISLSENANVANTVTTLDNFTTSNLTEGVNLYYTNTRVDAYINDFIDTDDITEANNLYYTNSRVDAYINDFIDTDDITEGVNLYYTNTRVDAYINDFIDTDDITEANNLYYTNTRVLSHIAASDVETLNLNVAGNLVVVGNLSYLQVQDLQIEDNMVYLNANSNISNPDLGWAGNYNDGTYAHAGIFRDASDGIFKIYDGYTPEPDESAFINVSHPSFRFANVQAQRFIGRISTLDNHTTSNLAEGINLYYTNARVDAYINNSITTNDITEEDNLYYTNARVDAYINDFIDTDDITEANNLYYTNTRVVSAVTPLLTTANVLELSSNLYYTNARVLAYVETLSIKDLRDVSNIYEANVGGLIGIQTGQALVWDGNVNQFVPVFVNSEIANVADLAVRVLSLEQFTTANIAEASSNLYFTNTRVLEALVDSNVIVNNLLVSGDLTVQGNAVTLNVAELVVEDKNITLANGAANALLADNSGITISGANATILYKESGDKFEINKNLDVTGNIVVSNNITGANLIAADTLEVNLITSDSITSNAITIINSATFANVLVEADLVGNLTGTADFVATLSNFTTDDLAEGTNLYYTNSRVLAHLAESDVTVQGLTVQGDLTVQGNTTTLNTATLVVEDKNVILANGAPNAAAADGAGITVEGANAEIVYVNATDSWNFNKELRANLTGNVTGFVSTISNFSTSNLTEGLNLYYTNARVFANVSEMSINVLADVDITGILNGQILAWDGSKFIPGAADIALFSERANVANVATTVTSLSNFTTDDLNEGSANLYFTIARAREAYSAGTGINISANGIISSRGEDDGSGVFNTGLTLSNAKFVDGEYSNVTYFSNTEGSSFIVYSMHLTNLTSQDVYLAGRYQIDNSNIMFANLIRMPGDSSLEMLRKPQVFKPGDIIQLKTYDSTGTPGNNLVSSYISYQGKDDDLYERQATSIISNTLTSVYFSNAKPTVVESIILNNLSDTQFPVTTVIADESDQVIAYLTSNLKIPKNTFVEICETPKVLKENYSIKVQKFDNPKELSVYVSSKVTAYVTVQESSSFFDEGSNIFFDVQTKNYIDSTTLYYSLDTVSGNITQGDFITPISGSFQVFDDKALLRLQSNADNNLNYEGDATFNILIRKGSESGTLVARSGNVTLRDSSNLYAFNLQATGGTVIDEGGYRYHIFEESGQFQVLSTAEDSDRNVVQYLAVGGGGGRSQSVTGGLSGGGGGEVLDSNISVSVNTYNVSVGAGGSLGTNGTNTEIFSQIVVGGGAGSFPSSTAGKNGSSGGGGTLHFPGPGFAPQAGGSGIVGKGNPGATGYAWTTPGGYSSYYGGGGGGSTTAGTSVQNAPVNTVSIFLPAGGYGKSVSWVPSSYGTANVFNSSLRVFGGGGDGSNTLGSSSPSPLSPQVQLLNPPAYPSPGPTHGGGYVAGGGGGGSARTQPSTTGHSGIVIIRYPYGDPNI